MTLTNRAVGSGQTVGAVTADLITLACGATPGTYQVTAHVAGFESTTPAGCGYHMVNGCRTTGAATTLTGTTDIDTNEEAALNTAKAELIASGNNLIVRVTGTAALTINWVAKLEFIFVS